MRKRTHPLPPPLTSVIFAVRTERTNFPSPFPREEAHFGAEDGKNMMSISFPKNVSSGHISVIGNNFINPGGRGVESYYPVLRGNEEEVVIGCG